MRYQRISADCHIDLPWIPPDLFTANASAALKDRMPYVKDGPDGPFWTAKNGMNFGLWGGVGPAGSKYVPGVHHRVDVMAATGLYDDGRKGIARPTDPALRARDMDRDGVQAEVIYGILGAATRLNDHEAATEMFHIYNDWLLDFCGHDPDRFIGWLPALRRHRRGGAGGLPRGQARPARHGAVLLVGHEPMWHPVWSRSGRRSTTSTCRSTSTPSRPCRLGAEKQTGLRGARLSSRGLRVPDELVNILAAIIGASVLERYRNCASLRRERHRLGALRARPLDFEWETASRIRHQDEPSDYWRRQCKAPSIRPHRHQADRRHGRGNAHVGLRLPARRRRVA